MYSNPRTGLQETFKRHYISHCSVYHQWDTGDKLVIVKYCSTINIDKGLLMWQGLGQNCTTFLGQWPQSIVFRARKGRSMGANPGRATRAIAPRICQGGLHNAQAPKKMMKSPPKKIVSCRLLTILKFHDFITLRCQSNFLCINFRLCNNVGLTKFNCFVDFINNLAAQDDLSDEQYKWAGELHSGITEAFGWTCCAFRQRPE